VRRCTQPTHGRPVSKRQTAQARRARTCRGTPANPAPQSGERLRFPPEYQCWLERRLDQSSRWGVGHTNSSGRLTGHFGCCDRCNTFLGGGLLTEFTDCSWRGTYRPSPCFFLRNGPIKVHFTPPQSRATRRATSLSRRAMSNRCSSCPSCGRLIRSEGGIAQAGR
jgi:hypothetical protein